MDISEARLMIGIHLSENEVLVLVEHATDRLVALNG
jgi:hypothetical protein